MSSAILKKIQLKTIERPGIKLDYREMLKTIVSTPRNPQQGTNLAEMREVYEILDLLNGQSDEIFVTLAQHKNIVERIENFSFAINDMAIVEFAEDVINAPKKE